MPGAFARRPVPPRVRRVRRLRRAYRLGYAALAGALAFAILHRSGLL